MFKTMDETGVCEIPAKDGYSDLSVQFKLGDKYRTVRLRNLEKMSIVEDIPESLAERKDVKAITEYMIQTADAYKEKMVFSS